jgi:hypothetical protein
VLTNGHITSARNWTQGLKECSWGYKSPSICRPEASVRR